MNNTQELKKQTSKANTIKVFKAARERTKKESRGFSISLFLFATLTLLSLGLGYFDPVTLILTIPFVVLPSYFALIAVNSAPVLDRGEIGAFFIMFRTYFNRMFSGCFRVIAAFFKALLCSIAFEVVSSSIAETIVFGKNEEFRNILFDGSKSFSDSAKLLTDFVNANPSFEKCLLIINCVSLVIGTMVFISHIAKRSPMLDFSFLRKQPTPMREFNMVDKKVRKEHKKEFAGRMFRGTWFISLLIILSFVGSYFIEMYAFKNFNPDHFFVLGLAIALIVILPFMNYLMNVYHIIYDGLRPEYENVYVTTTLEFLAKYREKLGINEEEAKKLEEIVKSQSPQKNKKEEKEKKDEK